MEKGNTTKIPQTQHAVQLIGPDELILNESKEVFCPAGHQVLCRIEAVGLCFSDLKLLKQFSKHARKSEIVSGIKTDVLKQIPSYVPGEKPTVPGHEAVIRIKAIGPGVENFKPGQRYLVQTDYRWLATANSNAAFGYNFEGALQQYVLMDERIITSPAGDSMLIPVSEHLSACAVALVEPWACVEDAYACHERKTLKKEGRMLIIADTEQAEGTFSDLFNRYGKSANITWVSKSPPPSELEGSVTKADYLTEINDDAYDDVIYFGCDVEKTEELFRKIAPHGLLNIVLGGNSFKKEVHTPVGRVHYGGIRIIGTTGNNPTDSMAYIPDTGEVRSGDKINVIGAAGPMGLMHVVRNICHDLEGLSVYAADVDDGRLKTLTKIVQPLAEKNNATYKPYNSLKEKITETFDYIVLMAPIPALVVQATQDAGQKGIINIFAGIPATVYADIDLNAYIKKQLYYIGTSGSTIEDMKVVLEKVESAKLDTNVSVAAISGLDGAVDGIRAVENRSIAGKIIVFPACKGLGLTTLEDLSEKMPEVAKHLDNCLWTKKAEQKLLEQFEQT